MTDVIADSLTRIRNASILGKKETILIKTKFVGDVLKVLRDEEMIEDYEIGEKDIIVQLKYGIDDKPVITNLKKVSSPGQRIYISAKDIRPVMNGRGIGIISTSKGVLSTAHAKHLGVGGEYICEVW
ncbi:MAG TPA: 30S ribosomal protein S8 [bacterium]|mgnify:CR=1 FL=1|nr:30S ribosomal protein S8 [bacterium]